MISALMEIAANPAWQEDYARSLQLELPGRGVRLLRHVDQREATMACSALLDKLEQPIRLEPFSKFDSVVRDRPQRDL